MRPRDLSNLLAIAFKHHRKVLIKGAPGIGKTDLVSQACDAIQFDLLLSHPAVSDPTDYKGMPAVLADGRAEFLPFGDLNRLNAASRLVKAHLRANDRCLKQPTRHLVLTLVDEQITGRVSAAALFEGSEAVRFTQLRQCGRQRAR